MADQKAASSDKQDDAGGTPSDLAPGVLIAFEPGGDKKMVAALADSTGASNVAYAADFTSAADMNQLRGADMTVFANVGVAVLDVDPDREAGLATLSNSASVSAIEKEPIFFAFADGLPPDFGAYLRGYRDAVDHLYDQAFGGVRSALDPALGGAQGLLADDEQTSWGLKATKVADTALSGKGVRVAILDTGVDLDHPDFSGRGITRASFIPGQLVQDQNGHGTHCVGTACGPRTPARGRRYGIAYDAEIFVGKVLTNQGSALGRSTLAGIEWAVRSGCHIISMSLGGLVLPGQRFSQVFEMTARRALDQNVLIVAAAGNDSRRSQGVRIPVSNPANCPSVMAVAALDRSLRVADFSNSALNPDASVDIAGPGVDIYSSAPEPSPPQQPPRFRQWAAQHDVISGTSMATPHVAGIAALLKEANPSMSASDLWRQLASRASALPFPASDVGAGLVQV